MGVSFRDMMRIDDKKAAKETSLSEIAIFSKLFSSDRKLFLLKRNDSWRKKGKIVKSSGKYCSRCGWFLKPLYEFPRHENGCIYYCNGTGKISHFCGF